QADPCTFYAHMVQDLHMNEAFCYEKSWNRHTGCLQKQSSKRMLNLQSGMLTVDDDAMEA
ncbi:hypothetical protein QTP70_026699, partial [Hemibagrus guttatus]